MTLWWLQNSTFKTEPICGWGSNGILTIRSSPNTDVGVLREQKYEAASSPIRKHRKADMDPFSELCLHLSRSYFHKPSHKRPVHAGWECQTVDKKGVYTSEVSWCSQWRLNTQLFVCVVCMDRHRYGHCYASFPLSLSNLLFLKEVAHAGGVWIFRSGWFLWRFDYRCQIDKSTFSRR